MQDSTMPYTDLSYHLDYVQGVLAGDRQYLPHLDGDGGDMVQAPRHNHVAIHSLNLRITSLFFLSRHYNGTYLSSYGSQT